MKILITTVLILVFASFMAGAKDAAKAKKKHASPASTVSAEVKKDGAPCETKEDILKKLEEEKKAKEAGEKPKAFSLQGGNTGCSVK